MHLISHIYELHIPQNQCQAQNQCQDGRTISIHKSERYTLDKLDQYTSYKIAAASGNYYKFGDRTKSITVMTAGNIEKLTVERLCLFFNFLFCFRHLLAVDRHFF